MRLHHSVFSETHRDEKWSYSHHQVKRMKLTLLGPLDWVNLYNFIKCAVHLLLLCTMVNNCTIISQIITLLNVSTLLCHPQGVCNQYFAKLHKYFKSSCWYYNLQLRCFIYLKHLNIEKCRSVIICEIIVNLWAIVQNKKMR